MARLFWGPLVLTNELTDFSFLPFDLRQEIAGVIQLVLLMLVLFCLQTFR